MKKLLLLGVFGFTMFANSFVSAQAVEQGKIIIDPYYGFPNFGKNFANSFDGDADVKVKGIGPMGLRAEYMVADKFGIGIDFIYNSFSVTGHVDSLNNDGSVYKTYDVKAAMNRYRVQARFNYHFVENDKVDAYFGVGAGTNIRVYSLTTDHPTYEADEEKGAFTALPFSMRVCTGMRFYFTENIGINAEIGLGGPVMSAGLSLKF